MTSAREAIEIAALTGQPVGHILSSSLTRASYARRVSLGVVGVITPWNAPFVLAARAVLPALANDTEYGLVASIFTADQARAMRVAAQLKTGIVHIASPF